MKTAVAIIPARGGSKRLPGKNIRPFLGQPVIRYSIQAAQRSGLFRRIIVSTDSEEIAAVARAAGAEVPFLRPESCSNDHAPLADVLDHALRWLSTEAAENDPYACCLLSTAPMIQARYLKQAYEILIASGVSSVIPVTTFDFPIFRAFSLTKEGACKMVWPEHELTRSNDLPEAYHDIGQFYWVETARFLEQKRFFAPDARAVVIPRHFVQDIDTAEDWARAELMFTALVASGEIERD
jgi:pseudaminic acid cytidylyltransferase